MDKFLIAPFKSGLQKGATPFLEPKDAFSRLNNAYIFRGKIKKRFGSDYTGVSTSEATEHLNSRLRINLGTTDGVGDLTVATVPGTIFKIGQIFSIGVNIFTIIDITAGAQDLLQASAITTATFNITTATLTIVGADATEVCWFYPSEPVLGLTRYESSTQNEHTTIAFDTQFAYQFSGAYWTRLGTGIWTGGKYDYYWSHNADGLTPELTNLYVTNFNKATPDPIKYYNGTNWIDFVPKFLTAGAATDNIIKTAKIVLPYKDRLLLLNTYEYDGATYTSHVNRCRYSWNGSPLATEAWYEPNQDGSGGGGYIDAPTEEEIVSSEFVRDQLIVYFENSTWALAYTGNEVLPFVWRKINTELGSQATFSSIPFDKHVLNVGLTGIQACNGNSVERIDEAIPDDIFEILNDSDQIKRIHGIRDYISEVVYWSFPKVRANDTYSYPDRVLVYNYKNNTWAYNDDCILTYGYFEQETGETWESDFETWAEDDEEWGDGAALSNTKQVIGGNQHGFVFLIDDSLNTNASVLHVSKVGGVDYDELHVEAHNLTDNDVVKITFYDLSTFTGYVTKIDDNTINVYDMDEYYNDDSYLGGATIERISKVDIFSTLWNPYLDKAMNVSLSKINFCVQRTTAGEIAMNYTISSADDVDLYEDGVNTGVVLGDNIIETSPYATVPFEYNQNRLWHSMYLSASGEFVRIRLYFNDEQMLDSNVTASNLTIEGMVLETEPAGDL